VDFERPKVYLGKYFRNSEELLKALREGRFEELRPRHRFKHTVIRGAYFTRNVGFKVMRQLWRLFHPAPMWYSSAPMGAGRARSQGRWSMSQRKANSSPTTNTGAETRSGVPNP